jgi:hypothetical protein
MAESKKSEPQSGLKYPDIATFLSLCGLSQYAGKFTVNEYTDVELLVDFVWRNQSEKETCVKAVGLTPGHASKLSAYIVKTYGSKPATKIVYAAGVKSEEKASIDIPNLLAINAGRSISSGTLVTYNNTKYILTTAHGILDFPSGRRARLRTPFEITVYGSTPPIRVPWTSILCNRRRTDNTNNDFALIATTGSFSFPPYELVSFSPLQRAVIEGIGIMPFSGDGLSFPLHISGTVVSQALDGEHHAFLASQSTTRGPSGSAFVLENTNWAVGIYKGTYVVPALLEIPNNLPDFDALTKVWVQNLTNLRHQPCFVQVVPSSTIITKLLHTPPRHTFVNPKSSLKSSRTEKSSPKEEKKAAGNISSSSSSSTSTSSLFSDLSSSASPNSSSSSDLSIGSSLPLPPPLPFESSASNLTSEEEEEVENEKKEDTVDKTSRTTEFHERALSLVPKRNRKGIKKILDRRIGSSFETT